MTTSKEPKVYFPGLNSLRFFAAGLVILSHLHLFASNCGYPNFIRFEFIKSCGDGAVTFFFVLSGFLITYLLFSEKDYTKTINVKHFYLRRILRIWPLYFFIFILSFLIMPHIPAFAWCNAEENINLNYWPKFLLFLFFVPNISRSLFPLIPYGGQAWSIGTEEQFYVIWPVLLKYVRNFLKIAFGIIAIFMLMKCALFLMEYKHMMGFNKLAVIKRILNFTRIQCMAIGGLGAYILYFKKTGIRDMVFSNVTQILLIPAFVVWGYIANHFKILAFINVEVNAAMFCILIMNVAANPGVLVNLRIKWLDYLGKISYGIYMYHPFGIMISFILLAFLKGHTVAWLIAVHIASFAISIIISSLSYTFFEERFIRMKHLYSKFVSGDEAKRELEEENTFPNPDKV